jgi:hypothetical protein
MNIKRQFQILQKEELDKQSIRLFLDTKKYHKYVRKSNALLNLFYNEANFYYESTKGSFYFVKGNFYDKDFNYLGGKFKVNDIITNYLSINNYQSFNPLFFFKNTPSKEIISLLNKTRTMYNIFTEEFFNLMFNAPLESGNHDTNRLARNFVSRFLTGELGVVQNVEIADDGFRITRTHEDFLAELRQEIDNEQALVQEPVLTEEVLDSPVEEITGEGVVQDLPF